MSVFSREKYWYLVNVSKFRVKIKSLAAEARIIRSEGIGRKGIFLVESLSGWEFRSFASDVLNAHRRDVVRPEQRHTLLAYAFYRGRPYSSVERPAKDNMPDTGRIARILKSLTGKDQFSDVREWLNGHGIAERQSA